MGFVSIYFFCYVVVGVVAKQQCPCAMHVEREADMELPKTQLSWMNTPTTARRLRRVSSSMAADLQQKMWTMNELS